MIVQQVLRDGVIRLKDAGIDGAVRDARWLMAGCLGIEAGRLTLHEHDDVPPDVAQSFSDQISRRIEGVPVSHLLGERTFYGRTFKVSGAVLDPRPETEELVAAALQVPFEQVLDLGTGSGCIVLSLLAERPLANGMGVDASAEALDVARQNRDALGLTSCVFLQSDWFEAIEGAFDLIVSNPPYIAAEEMAGLSAELSFEPRMALTDEADGLSCYRIICSGADSYLKAGGWLMVEIGPTQGGAVTEMMTAAGMVNVEIRRDLDGRDRVVLGQKRP